MIALLLGVPGKLKRLIDYLDTHIAPARAARLDFLTGTVATAAGLNTSLRTVAVERYQDFTASGNFIPSAALLARGGVVRYQMVGGGGGRSSSDTFPVSAPSPGAYKTGFLTVLGTTAIAIGAGGVDNTSAASAFALGTAGGVTTFGAVSAAGGATGTVGGDTSLEALIVRMLLTSSSARRAALPLPYGGTSQEGPIGGGFCRVSWTE
jgi:hypothetical protein